MTQEPTLPEAVDILRKHLESDPDYYKSWQANIAMAFKDEYQRTIGADELIHDIANNAAKNFLNLLIK